MVNSSGSLSRYIVAGALFMTGLLPGGTAAAQTRQQIDWCVNDGNLFSRDLQISGCTAVIQSGQREERDLSWAFHNRAYAYYKKDNYQDAIVDFNEAIRLNPIDATALNNRCWVRTIVGRDLSQALEDCY